MRTIDRIMSLFLILIFMNLTTGCHYYKVQTKSELAPEDIRWEAFNDKYFIMHYGDSAWAMNNISVDTAALKYSVSVLPEHHKKYLETIPGRSNKYKESPKADESYVLREVHLYSTDSIISADSIVTTNFSALEKMEIYNFDKGATVSSYVIPIVVVPVLFVSIVALIIALTKESCPYVYISENGTFKFVGEIYSGAIYASLERDDYLPLPGFMPDGDIYTLKIANELPEIQYINQAELWIADHPENTEAIADKYGVVHTLQSMRAPVASVSGGGTDLTGLLSEKDNQYFIFNEEPSLTGDSVAMNSITATFTIPVDRNSGKLVVRAKNSFWGDYVVGEFIKYFGKKYPDWIRKQRNVPPEQNNRWKKDQGLFLMVYLETNDGWQFLDYFEMTGPIAFREMVLPVDLSNGIQRMNDSLGQVKIKLESGFMFWEMDFAALDLSPDEPVEIQCLSPSSAINESGKEVGKLIVHDDKNYYVQPSSDNEVVLDFKSPQEHPGMKRSVILHTKGYYNHIRHFQNPPERELLETFRRPGRLSEFSLERFLDVNSHISMKPTRDNK